MKKVITACFILILAAMLISSCGSSRKGTGCPDTQGFVL